MTVPLLQLGLAVNLLRGLRPAFCSADGENPWLPVAKQPLVLLETPEPEVNTSWQGPRWRWCETLEDLLDALFPYQVYPFQIDAGRPYHLPTSAFLLAADRREAAITRLSALLGFEIRPGDSYHLLSVRRETGNWQHEAERGGIARFLSIKNYWTREGRNAMARLRTGDRQSAAALSGRQAQRYLDYFYEFGTHFVSRIVTGQILFQVFRCRPERQRFLATTFKRESGGAVEIGLPLIFGMRPLLGPEFVDARGSIRSSCEEPALSSSRQEDLLEPLLRPSPSSPNPLALFQTVGPIGFGLTPQSSLMENFRAVVASQVLKGALTYEYGETISLNAPQTLFDGWQFAHLIREEDGLRLVEAQETQVRPEFAEMPS